MKSRTDRTSFSLQLSSLTPFLVSSGRVLGRFDYTVTVNPRTGSPLIRVIDTERFIDESGLPPEKIIEAIEKRQSGSLNRFSRYVLSCAFRQVQEGLELQEFNRDGEGKPLVPASTLRGLLRTLSLFTFYSSRRDLLRQHVEGAMEGRWKRERAADKLERRVLGRSREVDLFQALKISDPEAVSNEDLKAYEVSPMTLAGGPLRPGENRYLEALNPKASVSFQYRVTVDRAVFSQRQNSDGRRAVEALFRDREAVLVALRSFSRTLIEAERKFYSDSGARDLLRRFDEIMKQAEGRIAIPFGFGSGWQGKTMGLLLTAPDLNRLAPLLSPGRSYYRRGGQPVFPKTRRWVLEAGRPVEPLGWVLVE